MQLNMMNLGPFKKQTVHQSNPINQTTCGLLETDNTFTPLVIYLSSLFVLPEGNE